MDGLCKIRWSGSFAQVEGGGLFEEDPRTWGPKGWAALATRVEEERTSLGGVAVRPHARHVISDIPSCRRIIEQEPEVMLCYDPASMMTPAMMGRGEDHLRRMYEALEQIPAERLAMVVVSGVDAGGKSCGIDECGEVGRTVAKLAAEWVPESVPLAVLDDRVGEQVEMLRQAGA